MDRQIIERHIEQLYPRLRDRANIYAFRFHMASWGEDILQETLVSLLGNARTLQNIISSGADVENRLMQYIGAALKKKTITLFRNKFSYTDIDKLAFCPQRDDAEPETPESDEIWTARREVESKLRDDSIGVYFSVKIDELPFIPTSASFYQSNIFSKEYGNRSPSVRASHQVFLYNQETNQKKSRCFPTRSQAVQYTLAVRERYKLIPRGSCAAQ